MTNSDELFIQHPFLRPRLKQVVLKQDAKKRNTAYSFHTGGRNPEQEPLLEGILVAKGPEAAEELVVGQRYLFNRFSGSIKTISPDNTEYALIPDDQVLATIDDEQYDAAVTAIQSQAKEASDKLAALRQGRLAAPVTLIGSGKSDGLG